MTRIFGLHRNLSKSASANMGNQQTKSYKSSKIYCNKLLLATAHKGSSQSQFDIESEGHNKRQFQNTSNFAGRRHQKIVTTEFAHFSSHSCVRQQPERALPKDTRVNSA
jgi:hypothetical protein